ncbi:glycine/betaine ABC transporter substrate-binding protein [Streptomyces sp. NTH33]|uniref:ABC transporter substrate-binding protein n=1 Tax=Streptomyces sp. NTH33 TaxID=1735453 RepID=UPI000DA8530B|nr:ABC transporter substrate-binding protein [Streptomyces sp. NTH33]PZH00229.1 glycine/betaine ABC transporter substrate-binding protein [Streptomyces sp. NTH33]
MRRRTTLTAAVAVLALTTGCGAADMTRQASPFAGVRDAKTVTLSVQSWVGSLANVAVAQYLLEHELGHRVDIVQIDEVPAWDALSQGRVDAILEDWGHPEQKQRYVEDKKTIAPGGDLGVTGHIGWFVPTYFAEKHPDIKDWKNLNKYADRFRTAESGGKGQLMDGSPAYLTHDKALVKNLELDFKVVFAGSEAALLTQIKQFAKEEKPFLTYWNTPHWLFEKVPMTEVKLPPYKEGCDADAAKVACAYPHTPLQKYLNADFARSGGKAAAFLKKFTWTTEDQNEVALMIADQKLTPAEAARKWVEGHESTWKAWLS